MNLNLEDFKKYMLTNENLNKLRNIDFNNKNDEKFPSDNKKDKVKDINKEKNSNFLFEDILFSCFFNILNENFDYELKNRFKLENEFKIDAISKLRDIKPKLKAIKLGLNSIENELLNEKKIGLKTLIALCLLYNKNLLYVCKNKYYEIINDNESKINLIVKENNNYELLENYENHIIQHYRDNYFQIENIEKPLKAISSYKKEELELICKKLQIRDTTNKSNKKEIYQKISENINLFF
tara:strand:+ start:714 stop:1430 length:717 start_codon:yes stop_codon:yes gene_type:complete